MRGVTTLLGLAMVLVVVTAVGYGIHWGLSALAEHYGVVSPEVRSLFVLCSAVFLCGAVVVRSRAGTRTAAGAAIPSEKANIYLEFTRGWRPIYLSEDDEAATRRDDLKALITLWAGDRVLRAFMRFLDAHRRGDATPAELGALARGVILAMRKDLGHGHTFLSTRELERFLAGDSPVT